jgi:hypothetical protein
MQFRDLKTQYKVLKPQIDKAIAEVVESGAFILGKPVTELENTLAEYVGRKHCVACGNGTDALMLALMAWGIGPGDVIFTSDFTFFASAGAASILGATVVLVDIDANRIVFSDLLNKYFFSYGSLTSSYGAFINTVIKPFKNSVKILMEDVIEGKIQDPIEALVEEEKRKQREQEEAVIRAQKDKELSEKAYGESIKAIREILLLDKKKVKDSKLKDAIKEEIILVIDMLANVIESEDKDAINYAFIAYKYVAKCKKLYFFGRVKKISKQLRNVLNGI